MSQPQIPGGSPTAASSQVPTEPVSPAALAALAITGGAAAQSSDDDTVVPPV